MDTAKLSKKYQVVVPKVVRKRLKLQAGSELAIYPLDDSHAIITKRPTSYADALQGLGKEVWQKLGGADKYIKEERASWEKK